MRKSLLSILAFCMYFVSANIYAALPEKIQIQTDAIEKFMEDHFDLSETLRSDEMARKAIFSHHTNIQKLMVKEVVDDNERDEVFDWYKGHINNYGQYFKASYISYEENPYLPQLRLQVWINFYESKIKESHPVQLVNSVSARRSIANTIGFANSDPRRRLLIKYKRLLADNDKFEESQVENVMKVVSLLPNKIIKAESIRVRDHLGMQINKDIPLAKRTGVNIFMRSTLSVIAHELNHTLDADNIKLAGNWDLTKRKHYILARAAGEDVIFFEDTYKIDLKSTKALFKEKGFWSGEEDSWEDDWYEYWLSGPGFERNQGWLRQAGPVIKRGIPLFIQQPQEILAGFANIYFADSQKLLETCISKWREGYFEPINQFLLFVDIYSEGRNQSNFYKADPVEFLTMKKVELVRGVKRHITQIRTDQGIYTFKVDENGIVKEIHLCQKV